MYEFRSMDIVALYIIDAENGKVDCLVDEIDPSVMEFFDSGSFMVTDDRTILSNDDRLVSEAVFDAPGRYRSRTSTSDIYDADVADDPRTSEPIRC